MVFDAVLIAIGAGLGACCRFLLAEWFTGRSPGNLPVATFVVNVVGALLLGLVVGIAQGSGAMAAPMLALAGTGFCGALTTFSTFSVEIVALARDGRWLAAVGYPVLSVAVALGAAAAGLALGGWLTA